MAARLMVIFGVLIVAVAFAAWWLLSGFGCAMNTSGCSSFSLDLHADALAIFVPPIALGVALAVAGIVKLRRK